MINYTLITKPGIIAGNLVTVGAGFLLASRDGIQPLLFCYTLLGLGLLIASACVFNNYIDRHLDRNMARTKNRPLATGAISGPQALVFGTVLLILSAVVLLTLTNALVFGVSFIGFAVYVFLYSIWKPRTLYATAIGSISGAIPPVAGYLAVRNELDLGALLFFMIMILWQMPHFHSIAIFRLRDYTNASVPVLPAVKGALRTKIHMLAYIALFIPAAWSLTFFGYTGYVYLAVVSGIGLIWLALCLQGFVTRRDEAWGRKMFYVSLVVICSLSAIIPLDLV